MWNRFTLQGHCSFIVLSHSPDLPDVDSCHPRTDTCTRWETSFISAVFCVLLLARAMDNENEKGGEVDLRQRIVSLIRANEQALRKPITDEEVQKLKAAAGRLDQILKAAVDTERQVLTSAAARLDQLLEGIATGKDVTNNLKRRRDWRERDNGSKFPDR